MKIKFLLVSILISNSVVTFSQVDVNEYLNKITIESIKAHVDTLASESMEGRNTGEPGQKLAAQYIANEFTKYGLTPFNPNLENPYYQKFNLYTYQTGESKIYYNHLAYRAPIYIGNKNISDSISGKLVFCGFANENDLINLEINNNSIFFLSKNVKQAINKAKTISNHYSVNTFVIGLPFGEKLNEEIFDKNITDFKSFKELYYYYQYHIKLQRNEYDFSKLLEQNKVIPNLFIDSEKDIQILFVPEKIASGLFLNGFKELKKIAKSNNRSKSNDLLSIKPANFSYEVYFEPKIDTLKTENVIGYLDSDLSNENIIIGAHYDHIGRNYNYAINYGADDNASGTTGMLSIAKLLSQVSKDGVKLKKNILFIAYSAEELGLHGSEYYVQNPFYPLSKTKVLFNLDMIGRDMDDNPENANKVFLLRWEGGSKYIKKVTKLNTVYTHLIVDKTPGYKNRVLWTFGSDHYSFVKKGISSIAYFTALHDDYHTPRDTADKLNYDKMNRIIKLVFLNVLDNSTK